MNKKLFKPKKNSKIYKNIEKFFNQLNDQLVSQIKQQNTLLFSEFSEYQELFNNNTTLSKEELYELSKSFFQKVNPYDPIYVIDDNTGELLFTLPPLFIPLYKIKTNNNNLPIIENIKNSYRSINPEFIQSSLDKYIMEFLETQKRNDLKSAIKHYRNLTKESINKIKNLSKNDNNQNQSLLHESEETSILQDIDNNDIEWE